jgi:hypothetical protein
MVSCNIFLHKSANQKAYFTYVSDHLVSINIVHRQKWVRISRHS